MNEPQDYPSLDLAYGWSQQSYSWLQARLDHHESRIARSLAFAASIALGVVAVVEGKSYTSAWFILALAAFVVLSLVAVLGDGGGRFTIIPIGKMRAKSYLSHDAFMRIALATADEDWHANNALLNRLAKRADWVTYLLGAEIALFIGWILW